MPLWPFKKLDKGADPNSGRATQTAHQSRIDGQTNSADTNTPGVNASPPSDVAPIPYEIISIDWTSLPATPPDEPLIDWETDPRNTDMGAGDGPITFEWDTPSGEFEPLDPVVPTDVEHLGLPDEPIVPTDVEHLGLPDEPIVPTDVEHLGYPDEPIVPTDVEHLGYPDEPIVPIADNLRATSIMDGSEDYIPPTEVEHLGAAEDYIPPTEVEHLGAAEEHIAPTDTTHLGAAEEHIVPTDTTHLGAAEEHIVPTDTTHLGAPADANKDLPVNGTYPTDVTDELAILGDEANREPDSVINTIYAAHNPGDAKLALANRIEKRKDAPVHPMRTMSDDELEDELKHFNAWNSMDPQITTEGSNKKIGDFFTLMQYGVRKNLTDYHEKLADAHPTDNELIDSPKHGIPFYFKDLRDGAYIFFRAYIDSLSENVTPSWNSENYIGRSEPVFTYTNATRDISIKFKLFASTPDELDMIYTKINKLTSLAYPVYKKHETVNVDGADLKVGAIGGKERMKPPLTKFRLGELYGDVDAELTGFLKSIAYTYDGPWEIRRGKRVPKYIEVDLEYQVIHAEVPSLDMAKLTRERMPENAFYGISKTILRDAKETRGW